MAMPRFRKGALTLFTGLLTMSAFSWGAGIIGAFSPKPSTNPPSIREGSMTGPLSRGHVGTRYFVGGGIHRGK